MKKFVIGIFVTVFLLGFIGCGKDAEFVMGENLSGAITELALKYDEFDGSATKEEGYPELFISTFCQNNRFTFDYLRDFMENSDGILNREQVEYIQYSLTGEAIDFSGYVGEDGIDIYQSTSGLGFGQIASYEGVLNGKEVNLVAQFEFRSIHDIEAEKPTKVYELTIVLEENKESCFDGYSIKSMSKKDVTPVVYGDGMEHVFYGLDMGIEENGVFILECFGGADEVVYGTHVEVDLSGNPALAEFIRENPGEELEVTFVWESTVEEPITHVIPTDINIKR